MMGRSPDFLNVLFSAWAGAADYFAQNRPEFKHNVLTYYEFIREQDCDPHPRPGEPATASHARHGGHPE